MRITSLHLILLTIAFFVIGTYVYQIKIEQQRQREIAAAEAARADERKKIEEEKRRENELAFKKEWAAQAVAVAGEYWLLEKQEGRDVSKGQETLHQAKEDLAREDFDSAMARARTSIEELKTAPLAALYYTVRRGDCLWRIARMPRHYGRGALWPRIWRANKNKIADPRLIFPRQVLRIPKRIRPLEKCN